MLVHEIRTALKKHIDTNYRDGAKRYFKEEIHLYGVRAPLVRHIAAQFYAQVKKKEKSDIFALCEELLQSQMSEDRAIAFDWAFRCKRHYKKRDFKLFQSWLIHYVSDWGACDDLCGHAYGFFIFTFPEFFSRVKVWARSKNRWLRRASAVVLIYSLRRKAMLSEAFTIADILLRDEDDLVQKGYGWMLKEATRHYPTEVFRYVMKHKRVMPRTALRYAIEKLPPSLKKKAMARDTS